MADSIFGRISQLMKANVNSLLDNAEDPEKMLDQMIRDFSSNISEAETAVATTIGNLRQLEGDHKEALDTAADWGGKASAAVAKTDQLRSAGQAADADKFENLAKIALKKQIESEQQAKSYEPTIAQQTAVVAQLKTGLDGMKGKLTELQGKRNELVSRSKMAAAQNQVQDAIKSVSLTDPTSEVSRFEDKIRREEARATGSAELAASSLDAQFASLDDASDDVEIEARLAALRSPSTPA